MKRAAKGATIAAAAGGAVYAFGAARFRARTQRGFTLDDPPAPGTEEFDRLIETISGAPARQGNRVELLKNGSQAFPSMLEAIAAAKHTIDFSSYIYWPDEVTEGFTDALCGRAEAGVDVNIVFDGWGSAKLDRDHVGRLEAAGAKVAFYRPPRWWALDRFNNRMHRRLLIIDGRVSFAGGVGIADVWTGDAQDPEHWRETHAKIEGPAARDVLSGFAENWMEATGELLGPAHLPELWPFDDGIGVQVMRSSPSIGGTAAAQVFFAAIAGARQRIWLTTAYFTAGPHFMDALAAAADRGVDVRILVNGTKVDKEVVRRTGQRSYGQLLEAGVRVFEYEQTMLHAKVLLADGWANVGSSNFDYRSFALDSELTFALRDPAVVKQLEDDFLDDLSVSREIDEEAWKQRPMRQRAGEWAGELFRQSL